MEVKSEISSSGAGGQFELLDMLAEVASQELQNEGRGVPAPSSKIPPKSKTGNPRNKRKSLVDYDSFDVGQIKRMSQVSLLKLFAEQVCLKLQKRSTRPRLLSPNNSNNCHPTQYKTWRRLEIISFIIVLSPTGCC